MGEAKESGASPQSPFAAGYEAYPQNFSNKYFGPDTVVETVKRLILRGFTRDNLRWGYYQKYAPPDPTEMGNWVRPDYYKNWESSVDEAREGLAKIPIEPNRPGPDPDNPKALAKTMLEHLDTAVKIALFDKHLVGNPNDSGIAIEIVVGKQGKKSRRHKVSTEWRTAAANHGDPKYKYDRLTITMTCPFGGWIGTAAWKYPGASKFTRFEASYAVPAAPASSDGQIIFIFNGLESLPPPPASGTAAAPLPPAILQPVLQWTEDGWAVRSWYVPATYTPSMEQMPGPSDERAFTTGSAPAWTRTTRVDEGTALKGVIEWDGMIYRCWFELGGDDTVRVAELRTNNILPLTYPVAVIEAYGFDDNEELVTSVTMTDIALQRSDVSALAVEPTWTVGTDDPPQPQTDSAGKNTIILWGTGRMQKYRVVPSDDGAKITFTRKDEYRARTRGATP
ncbi:MAG: hypothetical protein JO055_10415 [Alphaproteobacteria bacterium]|nr:hypothetical protein [Alphaproteobacteria bacterium]